jgi:hypothetical protein
VRATQSQPASTFHALEVLAETDKDSWPPAAQHLRAAHRSGLASFSARGAAQRLADHDRVRTPAAKPGPSAWDLLSPSVRRQTEARPG